MQLPHTTAKRGELARIIIFAIGTFIPFDIAIASGLQRNVGIGLQTIGNRLDAAARMPWKSCTIILCRQTNVAGEDGVLVRNFSGFDYVVAPSGSCVHQTVAADSATPPPFVIAADLTLTHIDAAISAKDGGEVKLGDKGARTYRRSACDPRW
jgi:hypothetical protein